MIRLFLLPALLIALTITITPLAAEAGDGVVTKPSAHDAKTTLDRLENLMKKKGITVFARINHSAGAQRIGQELTPTEILIFGNPAMGTPLMQANRTIAIDLPLKALAWTDKNGRTWLAYNSPKFLKARHKINNRDAVFEKMAKALDGLTSAATK